MCLSIRTLSLIVGWLHVISAAITALGLLILMCAYHNESYAGTEKQELISELGLHVILLLFIFSVSDIIFAILLLRGISEDRIKLMAPFVFGNYVALVILAFVIVIYFIADIASDGEIWIDLAENTAQFLVTLILFWPVHKLYHQMLDYPDHPDNHHLSESGHGTKPKYHVPVYGTELKNNPNIAIPSEQK